MTSIIVIYKKLVWQKNTSEINKLLICTINKLLICTGWPFLFLVGKWGGGWGNITDRMLRYVMGYKVWVHLPNLFFSSGTKHLPQSKNNQYPMS